MVATKKSERREKGGRNGNKKVFNTKERKRERQGNIKGEERLEDLQRGQKGRGGRGVAFLLCVNGWTATLGALEEAEGTWRGLLCLAHQQRAVPPCLYLPRQGMTPSPSRHR